MVRVLILSLSKDEGRQGMEKDMPQQASTRYDPAEMERQYNPRADVPNHEEFHARNVARSEAYRTKAKGHAKFDIAYGSDATETLDLFLPEMKNAPVHVFIHGGYWRSRDKRDYAFLAEPFVEAGALVAVVNYALCPAVTVEDIVGQIRACCAWIWRNIGDYGGDRDRIHLSGHSAGGHLAAMMLATDWPASDAGLPRDLVKSGVAISGVFEVAVVMQTSVQEQVRMTEDMAARVSPMYLKPATDAPVTVAVGAAESDEFRRQSREFAERWRGHGAPIEHFEVPGANHFTVLSGITEPDNPILRAALGKMGLAR